MRSLRHHLLALALLPSLSGCLAKTIVDVATAPVRIAGKAVDLATTSQSEADEKRGRAMRHREEQIGRMDRDYRKQMHACDDGDRDACDAARQTHEAMQDLSRGND
jgi:hypothetical protein